MGLRIRSQPDEMLMKLCNCRLVIVDVYRELRTKNESVLVVQSGAYGWRVTHVGCQTTKMPGILLSVWRGERPLPANRPYYYKEEMGR